MSAQYLLFTIPGCRFCNQARLLCLGHLADRFTEYPDAKGHDSGYLDQCLKDARVKIGFLTYPRVFVRRTNGTLELVGGCEDLRARLVGRRSDEGLY